MRTCRQVDTKDTYGEETAGSRAAGSKAVYNELSVSETLGLVERFQNASIVGGQDVLRG